MASTAVTNSDIYADTQLEVRRKLLFYLPGMVDDYASLVRDSDSPKDKLEFITMAGKLTGLEPKNDSGAGLTTVNFTINMNGTVTAEVATEAVEVVPVEKPTMLLPDAPAADAPQPATPEPALALDILPLDD